MANTIKLKRASGSDPGNSDLSVGELAIRTDTALLFTKKHATWKFPSMQAVCKAVKPSVLQQFISCPEANKLSTSVKSPA